MNKRKVQILAVYGTRPEAIKFAPVIVRASKSSEVNVRTVVTGQHKGMLDQVHAAFNIEPDINLDLFIDGQSIDFLLSRIIQELGPTISNLAPDAVMVQGDTTSSLGAALAAFYRQVPVIHLEAGLRSDSRTLPFPEEGNRRLISQIAAANLVPTTQARANLLNEGIPVSRIAVVGNTVIDALKLSLESDLDITNKDVKRVVESGSKILLVTAHRRESWGFGLESIISALKRIARTYSDDQILFPLHLNPIVRTSVDQELKAFRNVHITEPLSYHDFSRALNASHIVLSDSGGIQEEAPALGKPVLVLRDNTERTEALNAGAIRLVGTSEESIVEEVSKLKDSTWRYREMAKVRNLYGDGHAADRCIQELRRLSRQPAETNASKDIQKKEGVNNCPEVDFCS